MIFGFANVETAAIVPAVALREPVLLYVESLLLNDLILP
jgi:hypothetical protein